MAEDIDDTTWPQQGDDAAKDQIWQRGLTGWRGGFSRPEILLVRTPVTASEWPSALFTSKSSMTSGLQVLYSSSSGRPGIDRLRRMNGRLYLIAGVVALGGVGLSSAAYLVGRRQRDVARLADLPLAELQDRLASRLGIDSLRMTRRAETHREQWWHNATVVANIVFPMTAVISVAAALYAWIGR